MRIGVGFLVVLMGVGLLAYLWSTHTQAVVKQAAPIRAEAEQMSGRGPDGQPASESVKLDPQQKGGRTVGLIVSDITVGGALDRYFGLQKGDVIIKVGDFDVRDYPGGEDLAVAGVYEAAQRQQSLVVQRAGHPVTLTPTPPRIPGAPGSFNIPMH